MKIKRDRRFLKKVIRYTDQNRFDIIGKNYIFAGQVISNQLQIKYLFPSIQNILEKNNDKPEIITNAIQFYYSPTNFNICQVPYKNHAIPDYQLYNDTESSNFYGNPGIMETRSFNVAQSDYILTELGNVSSQSRTTSFHDKFELCKEINKEALHINNIESQLNKNANNNCITKSATITDAAEHARETLILEKDCEEILQ